MDLEQELISTCSHQSNSPWVSGASLKTDYVVAVMYFGGYIRSACVSEPHPPVPEHVDQAGSRERRAEEAASYPGGRGKCRLRGSVTVPGLSSCVT